MADPTNPFAATFSAHTQALLDNIRRANFPPVYTLPIAQARAAYRSTVGVSQVPAVPLARVEDFQIPGAEGALPARLWADSHTQGLPVLLYLHGGGFTIGEIATCDAMCRQLARQSGAAVVAVEYRLAPEHKYPAGLADAWAALNWLARQGGSIGVDGSRIAVGGDSAGGTLSATVALMARDAGLPLALQALIYPSVQTRMSTASYKTFSKGTLLSAELMAWFDAQSQGGDLQQDWHREPLFAPDHRGVAPAWIGLAECDALADDGRLYADKLREANVPVALRVWPGVLHDFINMGRFIPEAAQLHAEMAAAVKQALFAA